MAKWHPKERVQWERTIFSMHLASGPPILISQVQLQRFGAVAALKGGGVWAEEGCVKKSTRLFPWVERVSPECNQANENINRLQNKTSIKTGSSVKKKRIPSYQHIRRGDAEGTLLLSCTTKKSKQKKIQMKRFSSIFHFDKSYLSDVCQSVCACLCVFLLTHSPTT